METAKPHHQGRDQDRLAPLQSVFAPLQTHRLYRKTRNRCVRPPSETCPNSAPPAAPTEPAESPPATVRLRPQERWTKMAPLFCSAAAPKIKTSFQSRYTAPAAGFRDHPSPYASQAHRAARQRGFLFAHTGAQSLVFGQKTLRRVAAGGTDTVSLDPPVAVQCDPVFQRQPQIRGLDHYSAQRLATGALAQDQCFLHILG